MGATLTVDPKKHARLANRIVRKAIEAEAEFDHMVAAVERLMNKGEDRLSPEESALLETMAILVQAYDDRHHPLPSVAPNEMLAYLMETSGRTAKDLLPVLGTRGRVSEVLSGKRSISKEQAKKLAALFKVAVDLFIVSSVPGASFGRSSIPVPSRFAHRTDEIVDGFFLRPEVAK